MLVARTPNPHHQSGSRHFPRESALRALLLCTMVATCGGTEEPPPPPDPARIAEGREIFWCDTFGDES
ncbi:MAG TPA: hypothetical protein VGF45_03615, partial [Polyangia bacterium]